MQWKYLLTILCFLSSICALKNKLAYISNKLQELEASQGFLLIDGDNCRGKINFQVSKQELARYIDQWHTSTKSLCRPILFFDHGQNLSAYWYKRPLISTESSIPPDEGSGIKAEATALEESVINPFVVSFSGVSLTVDDCIVKDLQFIQNILKRDVCIITEDQELRSRCRKNTMSSSYAIRSRKKRVKQIEKLRTMRIESGMIDINDNNMKSMTTIDSSGFMEYLYETFGMNINDQKARSYLPNYHENINNNNPIKRNNSLDKIMEELLRQQVELQRALHVLEETLDTTTSRRIEMKLKESCHGLRQKLDAIISACRRLDGWDSSGSDSGSGYKDSAKDYDVYDEGYRLLSRLTANGRAIHPIGINGAEETWERVILAEKFRQELIHQSMEEPVIISKASLVSNGEVDRNSSDQLPGDSNIEETDGSIVDVKDDESTTTMIDDQQMRKKQELQLYIENVERNAHLHPARKRGHAPTTMQRYPTKKGAKNVKKNTRVQ